jgi:hypothetical protein
MIRAGFAAYVAAHILAAQNTASFWIVAVSFVLICIYGASGSFVKRRVLGSVLIYWMITPLILLGIFSISRMDYGNMAEQFGTLVANAGKNLPLNLPEENVFGTAWKMVVVMSSFELALFSFARTGKNERRQGVDLIRVSVWIIVSVLLAYVYVLGMLGNKYVESGNSISFGNKADYVLALSWLIGAFFVISSYIFYVKEMMLAFTDDVIYAKEADVGAARKGRSEIGSQGERQATGFRILMYALIFTGTLLFVCCFHYDVVRVFMINWLVYGDVPLSLLMPAALIIGRIK